MVAFKDIKNLRFANKKTCIYPIISRLRLFDKPFDVSFGVNIHNPQFALRLIDRH